jgi:hypothetical protein
MHIYYIHAMDESNNIYVSSRGILKSCNYYSSTPRSSVKDLINYPDINNINNIENPVIYICSSAIPQFITNMLSSITKPFILVSGDCDETIPHDIMTDEQFESFINNDLLMHWFCQNMIFKHNKITCIPIGLDYHTMTRSRVWGRIASAKDQEIILEGIKRGSLHFSKRHIKCYANFQFLMSTRYGRHDRRDAYDNIDKELVYYEPNKISRINTWHNQTNYAFVISPHGNGYDCHRTWEALILGCIPIVKKSDIDVLYEELPVLIVNEWKDITHDLLLATVACYQTKEFNYDKLNLKYWVDMITRTGTIYS